MAKKLDAPAPPAPGSVALGPIVWGLGDLPAEVMFLGTAPNRDDCRAYPSQPFMGRPGGELNRYLDGQRLPFRRDCWLTYMAKQMPYGKVVSAAELDYWAPELQDELACVQPEVIVTLGALATKAFLGPTVSMERVHGLAFGRVVHGRPVTIVPTYSPGAILHSPDLQSYFSADMEALSYGLLHGFRNWMPDLVTTRYELLPLDELQANGGCWPTTFSVDTEGWAHDPWGLTISWNGGYAWLVPHDDEARLAWVREAMTHAKRVTCQGLLYDLDVLAAMDITIPEHAFDDTQIMAYLLSLEPQSLKDLAYRHLGAAQEEYTELTRDADEDMVTGYLQMIVRTHTNEKVVKAALRVLGKIPTDDRPARAVWKQSKFSQALPMPPAVTLDNVDRDRAITYACRDADLTNRLRPILHTQIVERGLEQVYQRDMHVIPIVHRMQHVGMRVNMDHFRGLLTTFTHEYLQNQEAITALLGYELNPNSGDQVAELLFNTLHLPTTKLTKSRKRYSTQDKYLEALVSLHPIVPLITEGREITKLKSAYAAAILTCARPGKPYDGSWFVYPNLRITRVETGRVSAFDPNVLAIPKHSARGKLIRQGFIAGTDRVLLSLDLSQIELRVAAHDANCQGMIDVFRAGGDLHAALGERLFGIKAADQDESKHRLPCKKVNFGIWMGISAGGISDQLAAVGVVMSVRECEDLIAETFKVWPEIPIYQNEKMAQARRLGYVTDFCGRRRYLAGVHSPTDWVRSEAERQAHATPVQSGAQEVFKTWMANCWTQVIKPAAALGYLEPWLQVHDDLIVEVEEGLAERTTDYLMAQIPQMLCVPVTAKAAQATTWGGLE